MGNTKGYSLLEIMLTIVILAIAIVPMINAFSPAIFSTARNEEEVVFTSQAQSTINRVMALNFARLDSSQADPVNLTSLFGSAVEAAKEDFTLNGKSYTPEVAISDVTSAGKGRMLLVTVSVDQVSLNTCKADF